MAKILLVEDESSLVEVYSEFLESEGHEVLKALDGEEGLILAQTEDWEIMFLDIMLPKLDGIELLKRLGQENKIAGRPIVMLTNLDTEEIIAESLSLGAREHLSKANINPQSILNVVKKYLSKKGDGGEKESDGKSKDGTKDDDARIKRESAENDNLVTLTSDGAESNT